MGNLSLLDPAGMQEAPQHSFSLVQLYVCSAKKEEAPLFSLTGTKPRKMENGPIIFPLSPNYCSQRE